MQQIVELEEQEIKDFPQVDGITSATVCKATGLLPKEGCETRTEYFAVGTVPTQTCGATTVEMCEDSKLPATDTCPNKFSFTYMVQPDGSLYIPYAYQEKGIPEDFQDQTCPLHPSSDSTEANLDTFTISSTVNGTGGTITESAQVPAGGSKTFYIIASDGYAIKDVLIDGKSVGAVSSYTFTDLDRNRTISASFTAAGGNINTSVPSSETTEAPSTDTTAAPPPSSETTAPVQ